jgi:pimeloyl-ACP methyl ester carboxylesterase
VLWETPYQLDAAGQQAALDYRAKVTALLDEGRRGEALEAFMTMVGMPEQAIAGMRQSPHWAAGEALAPTLAYDAAVMGDGSLPDELGRIAVPTTAMAGGASPGWMVASAEAAAAAVPGGRCVVLPGQTHAAAPDVLAAAVREAVAAYADQP